MRSEPINWDNRWWQRTGGTYGWGNKRIFLQKSLYCRTIDGIVLLVYEISGGRDSMTTIHVIYAGKCITLCHVSTLAHVGHMIFWYQASRTKAVTKVSYTNNKNSVMWFWVAPTRRLARLDLLLAIVSRICKYSRIETATNPVAAVNHDAMHKGL